MVSDGLLRSYRTVRGLTEALVAPLETEDFVIQSMPDASPAKWHLAHTSWFFETFVLRPGVSDYAPKKPEYQTLFNSYYVQEGPRHARPERGLLSRPTVREVRDYRALVDDAMHRLLDGNGLDQKTGEIVELGLHHEQQHQELLLTDLKHMFSRNPLRPAYAPPAPLPPRTPLPALRFVGFEGGTLRFGHSGGGFAFDNESPEHQRLIEPFRLASRLVTCGEYIEFMEDGGYEDPTLWLSDGWDVRSEEEWSAPLYWERDGADWLAFSLSGPAPVNLDEPVCHVSAYEADAFARWRNARLPTEFEWEAAARRAAGTGAMEDESGNLLEIGVLHPRPATEAEAGPGAGGPGQMFGDAWEWTASAYLPYPRYRPPEGSLGEYNGKFMANQLVLRGGSCATPRSHLRATYRNFFRPSARWQFAGIRLARDA